MPRTELPPLFYVPPPDEEDEDETVKMPARRQIVRRRSSHLERWIEDQHRLSTTSEEAEPYVSLDEDAPGVGTPCHPYLAYPNLTTRYCNEDSYKQTLESFVVVTDEDIKHADAALESEHEAQEEEEQSRAGTPFHPPPIDISTAPKSRKYSGLLHAPSHLRNLNLSLHSRRLSSSTAISSISGSPPSSSGPSQCQSQPGRPSTSSNDFTPAHKRGHSWGSILLPGGRSSLDLARRSWKLRSATSLSVHPIDEDDIAPPRPSFSSADSCTRSNNTWSTDAPVTPQDFSGASIRTVPTYFSRYSSPPVSEFSGPTSSVGQYGRSHAEKSRRLSHKASTIRVPFASKPSPVDDATLMAPTTLPRTMRFGSNVPDLIATRKSRRKKLCITGLQPGEVQRFEAVKKWCQSFGELSAITRMPNGDIYVHFRRADVADTVCRLNAGVRIEGAGSVSLSWFTGKKPS
ncbi:hypothetical protein OE88DRAFT_1640577 [Heliocybe sulcata]|uniref:RRM domain-containing protein n=1 Tax=Heliocybe sulcata TaxID=5364 RepID=A0A5C3NFM7_9AGAM|nr:hypothetical protein OE88DRAFT_1640577 [Heliocybe sulcata]